MVTWKGPKASEPDVGQYCSHCIFPSSTRLVIITTEGTFSCHIILQKSTSVVDKGPAYTYNTMLLADCQDSHTTAKNKDIQPSMSVYIHDNIYIP